MKTSIRTVAALIILGISSAIFTAGCAGTPTRKSTGEFLDDAGITAQVKTAFVRDPVVQALDVKVDTFRGTVQLNGFVDTPEQRVRAEQLARSVPGIVGVQNQLSVKTETAR